MSRRWHKGPPPHVGWWNASTCEGLKSWRWWDGEKWSAASFELDRAAEAARLAKIKVVDLFGDIEWTDYYPNNARVPRIDPRKVK